MPPSFSSPGCIPCILYAGDKPNTSERHAKVSGESDNHAEVVQFEGYRILKTGFVNSASDYSPAIAYILLRRRRPSYANHSTAQIGKRAATPSTYSLTILRRHVNHFRESTPEISRVEYMECTLASFEPGLRKLLQDRQKKVEMVRNSRLLYLICYMLKRIDFEINFECAEPFCRNTNFTENIWRFLDEHFLFD